MSEQQSHHCGIESNSNEAYENAGKMQQSHHCGIESVVVAVRRMRIHPRSNRTIVGLKVEPTFQQKHLAKMQQSHHCGIESIKYLPGAVIHTGRSNRTIVGLKACL